MFSVEFVWVCDLHRRAYFWLVGATLEAGNAFLTPESIAPGVTEKEMIGSVMVFEAESLEEVRKIVENDIYYTTGVVSSRFPYRIRFK